MKYGIFLIIFVHILSSKTLKWMLKKFLMKQKYGLLSV